MVSQSRGETRTHKHASMGEAGEAGEAGTI